MSSTEARQIELLEIESSQRQHNEVILNEYRYQLEETKAVYSRFTTLKPRMYRDGNMWCVNSGEVDEQDIIGFGKTPHLAIVDWDRSFNTEIKLLTKGGE